MVLKDSGRGWKKNGAFVGPPWLAAVSIQCLSWCKFTVAPTKRQCSATVGLWERPFSRPRNVVLGSRLWVLDMERMLDTQEVVGSSPISPITLTPWYCVSCVGKVDLTGLTVLVILRPYVTLHVT